MKKLTTDKFRFDPKRKCMMLETQKNGSLPCVNWHEHERAYESLLKLGHPTGLSKVRKGALRASYVVTYAHDLLIISAAYVHALDRNSGQKSTGRTIAASRLRKAIDNVEYRIVGTLTVRDENGKVAEKIGIAMANKDLPTGNIKAISEQRLLSLYRKLVKLNGNSA